MASEVFKVSLNAGVSNSESVLINGVNGHTYVILSIIVTETAGAAETFVFNDRLIIEDEDHLCAQTANSANVDITVNYLDQTR